MSHIPVLLKESIEGLNLQKGGIYVDCTTNRGGHSLEIAKIIGKKGILICIDLDKGALKEAKKKLSLVKNPPKYYFAQSNFRFLKDILKKYKISKVNGILADFGLSSEELDSSGRGFSFRFNEPLQMTFDSHPHDETVTAEMIVNNWSEETIADILYGFADEIYSRRIAKAIIKSRRSSPIKTTTSLVEIIRSAVPTTYRKHKVHFATKTFQALRMATNDELGSIKDLIDSLPDILVPNGRTCVITFHSTEDRIVKQEFRSHADTLKILNKKAILPTREEIKENPRSRSAQLRIVEKI